MGIYIQYIYIYIYIYKIVVLASEPVGGRSRATELPCLYWDFMGVSPIFLIFVYIMFFFLWHLWFQELCRVYNFRRDAIVKEMTHFSFKDLIGLGNIGISHCSIPINACYRIRKICNTFFVENMHKYFCGNVYNFAVEVIPRMWLILRYSPFLILYTFRSNRIV